MLDGLLTTLAELFGLSTMQGRAPQMSPISAVFPVGIFSSLSRQRSSKQNFWKSNEGFKWKLLLFPVFVDVFVLKNPRISLTEKHDKPTKQELVSYWVETTVIWLGSDKNKQRKTNNFKNLWIIWISPSDNITFSDYASVPIWIYRLYIGGQSREGRSKKQLPQQD